jgi:hypothetical protein
MKGTTLLQPHRRLIREGPLQSISTKSLFGSIKMSNRVFFLFSDILLWTGTDFEFKGIHMNSSLRRQPLPSQSCCCCWLVFRCTQFSGSIHCRREQKDTYVNYSIPHLHVGINDKLCRIIKLSRIITVMVGYGLIGCGFEINTSTKSIILHCKDDAEKQSWLTEIKAVVK